MASGFQRRKFLSVVSI